MLQAPASNSSHLALLEPNTLYGSIAHYLSALPTEHVGDFASTVAQSGCLWATTAQGAEGAAAVFERANHISKAVARAALKRIELVVREREGSTGWRSRRRLSQWVSAIIAQVQTDVSSSALGQAALSAELAALHGLPIARLSILTGLLSGLQVSKQASSGSGNVGLNVRAHIRTVEDEWVVSFAECLDRLERIKSGEQESEAQDESKLSEWEKEFRRIEALKKARSAGESTGSLQGCVNSCQILTCVLSRFSEERLATSRKAAEVPLFLGAQVMPMISDRKLEALPTDVSARPSGDASSLRFYPYLHVRFSSLGAPCDRVRRDPSVFRGRLATQFAT